MADFNAGGADTGVDMLDPEMVDFAGQDPGGVNSSTRYTWLTSGGHSVEARGSGISGTDDPPTSGTVHTIHIDLSDDGDVDHL